MTDPTRRTFLKHSGLAASALAMGAGPDRVEASPGPVVELEPTLLRAVGAVVLPAELGSEAREGAIRSFEEWAADYDPVAELNHGYGTSEIRYGPPDPMPGWTAQLVALDIEARKRHGTGFAELDGSTARTLLDRNISDVGPGMPNPLRAEHVATALMAHWFSSADAIDRCYEHDISPRTCRGLEASATEPESLS